MDINPEYSDSLDSELFTVHLMFEKPTAETAQQALTEAQRVGSEHSNSSAVNTIHYIQLCILNPGCSEASEILTICSMGTF